MEETSLRAAALSAEGRRSVTVGFAGGSLASRSSRSAVVRSLEASRRLRRARSCMVSGLSWLGLRAEASVLVRVEPLAQEAGEALVLKEELQQWLEVMVAS